ncbi:MAG TPA: multicopper oxidase domain-containing protein, partial [Pedobacter sp.]
MNKRSYGIKFLAITVLFFAVLVCHAQEISNDKPKTVRYNLTVGHKMVNYTGKMGMAMAINDSIPGPVLYFTEGDTAEIYVHNTLKEETSIHWHGLILPNRYDG